MAIVLEPHNPIWDSEFSRVKNELQITLQDIADLSIIHVGSTSIPGLIAKPILDIDIVVHPQSLSTVRAALSSAGYEDRGELGVPGRFAFRQPPARTQEMRRNTYVVLKGYLALRNHLDLRRILLEDIGLREEYGDAKRRLVQAGVTDLDEYCRGKNEVMFKILRKAGWNEDDLEEVRKANES